MDGSGGPDSWHPLWYAVGAVLGVMIGAALGGSFVKERGRRVLPVVIVSTLVFAVVVAWALNLVMYTFYAGAFH
jgi:hypothetical protein